MRATEIDPEYAEAQLNKAVVLNRLERFAEATDAFERYLVLGPEASNAGQIRAAIELLRAEAAKE